MKGISHSEIDFVKRKKNGLERLLGPTEASQDGQPVDFRLQIIGVMGPFEDFR